MPLDFSLLSMTELRNRPGEILDRVADGGEMFLIERSGQRRACLVPLSFFFPDVAPSRIADEMNQLIEHGEKPRTSINDSRELVFRFPHKLAENSLLEIEIVLPHGYPNTCPRVYASPIAGAPPHRWNDGALCLYGVLSGWNPGKHTAFSTLALARQWLRHYDTWRQSGQWPKPEGTSDE
jgi:prevent-host-death family protein